MSAPDRNIDRLLNPQSIAIVGASESSDWASAIVTNLRDQGYPGELYMVNPRRDQVFGQHCYDSVAEIGLPIDHAAILTPAHTLPGILRDCAQAGVGGVTVVASGFQEAGESGTQLASEVRELCREFGIEMVGPNCYGFSNFTNQTFLTKNHFERVGGSGSVGMVFQSGQINLATCQVAAARGLDLAFAISSGNELVTTANDYFEYFLSRDDCRVIGGSLERIPEPERFARMARRALELGKPIVLLKLGRSQASQGLAVAHTGSVAGDDVVVDTFLRDLGVIRVQTIEELVETTALLARKGWPTGGRTVFTSLSGGTCGLFADMCDSTKISFPALDQGLRDSVADRIGLNPESVLNPMDLTTSAVPHIEEVSFELAESGTFDIMVHNGEEPRNPSESERFGGRRRMMDEITERTGVYTCFFVVADRDPTPHGIADNRAFGAHYLHGMAGIKALDHAISYGEFVRRAAGRPARPADETVDALELPAEGGALSERASKAILKDYRIESTREEVAEDAAAAVAIADSIGYPVVLKIVSSDIPHKSEAGGVLVGVADAAAVRAGFDTIIANALRHNSTAVIDGVLVCEMVTDATEFFIGITSDPDLGPIVVAGLGGIYVEILKDFVTASPGITADEAEELLMGLASAPILNGARGKAPLDVRAFAEAIARAGQLAADYPDRISEVDINPLFVRPEGRGAVAGDALVVVRAAVREPEAVHG